MKNNNNNYKLRKLFVYSLKKNEGYYGDEKYNLQIHISM